MSIYTRSQVLMAGLLGVGELLDNVECPSSRKTLDRDQSRRLTARIVNELRRELGSLGEGVPLRVFRSTRQPTWPYAAEGCSVAENLTAAVQALLATIEENARPDCRPLRVAQSALASALRALIGRNGEVEVEDMQVWREAIRPAWLVPGGCH